MATSFVVHPDKDQLKAFKAYLNAYKLRYEEKEGEKLPDYVIEGFKESQRDFAEGRFKKYSGIEDLFTK